jgi:hypothetical protein
VKWRFDPLPNWRQLKTSTSTNQCINFASSIAPSYFSQFFQEQLKGHRGAGDTSSSSNSSSAAIDASSVRTLYIDRDPATFCDISLHLQGYHIEPRDGSHFVKLLADAQFFSRKFSPVSPNEAVNP